MVATAREKLADLRGESAELRSLKESLEDFDQQIAKSEKLLMCAEHFEWFSDSE